MRRRLLIALVGIAIASLAVAQATARDTVRFYEDDPLTRVPESQDASRVQARETSLVYEMVFQSFGKPGDPRQSPALNVNTIDEVPDSSWFTNRIGGFPLSPAEVANGPDRTAGPDPGRWMVVASKQEGVTPGFTIRDGRGETWFIKFDPPDHPDLATGAEVVSTKLFHALGYFVPENHVAFVRRDQLVPDRSAMLGIAGRRHRAMRDDDIDRLLGSAVPLSDGRYRVLASRALAGTPVGPFTYYGRRSDDPNDLIPHEHRRELRALRVFAAWTQHVDIKGGNTLDTLVKEGGRVRVRHHLIDLGSTLGSAGVKPRDYNEGYESLVELHELWRGIVSFGFRIPPWRTVPYAETPAVGRFEAEHFDPNAWVPSVPNPAFVRAQPADLFWGARRVAAVSDYHIRAAVSAGRYSDRSAEQHLSAVLIGRRNRILRAWLPIVNPIVAPELDADGVLRFVNAAVAARVSPAPRGGYRARWFAFDNATGTSTPFGEDSTGRSELQAPRALPDESGAMVRVDVAAIEAPHESWHVPVRLYFRRQAGRWVCAGLTRDPVRSSSDPASF